MNNSLKCVAVGHNKKTTIETKTKLNQAYDLVNDLIKDTNYYIANGTDIIGDSIHIAIVGNINEQLDTNKLKEFATVTKTKTKNNKVFLTLRILKKTINEKNKISQELKPLIRLFNKIPEKQQIEKTRIQKINHFIVKCNEQKKYNYMLFPKQQKEIDELREKIHALKQSIKDIQECRRIIKRL
jgi:hypothetical protein